MRAQLVLLRPCVDDRPRGECEGCRVLLPDSELREGPRIYAGEPGRYYMASERWWCPACCLDLWAQWDAMVRRRSLRGFRAHMERVRAAVQLPLVEVAHAG